MGLEVKIWGCRGSLPAPLTPQQIEGRLRETLLHFSDYQQSHKGENSGDLVEKYLTRLKPHQFGGFGGHTACIQVYSQESHLVVDGGSGIRRLGEQLMLGPCGLGKGVVDILFTHFHWDHLIGIPFFIPIFVPGNKIRIHAVQDNLEAVFKHVFQKPYFPVPFERLGAKLEFYKLSPREPKMFGDIQVTPYQLDHPDPCWGYKFEHQGKTFSYCVDTECLRVTQKELGPDLPLYQNVDLMIFDAQYSFLEATEKIDWGHASAPIGLDLAMREKVKRILFVHHDPAASDEKVAAAEKQTRDYYESRVRAAKEKKWPVHELEWEFAREGTHITL